MADCSTFDTLVVDWLYDELDPAEAARVTRHVDGCAACWQTAESLVQIRGLMRTLPEEEPPAAISARVLREAAAHAASRQGRGLGLLVPAWVTGALGRAWAHPAAAAVASLVLVAGVAGALFARDRLEAAAPRMDSAAVHREAAHGEASPVAGVMGGRESGAPPPAPAGDVVRPSEMEMAGRDDDARRDRGRFAGAPAQAPAPTLATSPATSIEEKRAAERARRTMAATPASRAQREVERGLAARNGDAEEQAVSVAQDMADEALPGRSYDEGGDGYRGGAGGGTGDAVQAPEAAAPRQKAAAEPAGLDKREYAQPTAAPGSAEAKPRTETWAESRHAELRAALSDEQCTRAIGIASDIQAREPGYYRSQLASSKELEACRVAARKAANRAGKGKDRRASEQGTAVTSKPADSAKAE
jgi:hypothetical protein